MWFSYRGNNDKYKIGYAFSEDAIHWHLKNEDMEDFNSPYNRENWEKEMLCYPYVFKHKDRYYMLYNGNGYGKSGIGLAVLESEL